MKLNLNFASWLLAEEDFKSKNLKFKIKLFKNLKFGQYDKIKEYMKKEEGNNLEIDPNYFSVNEEISRVVELAKKTWKN